MGFGRVEGNKFLKYLLDCNLVCLVGSLGFVDMEARVFYIMYGCGMVYSIFTKV